MNTWLSVAVVGLLLTIGCGGKTALSQTAPSTWSQGGWQGFRWRMGPGDVELKLRTVTGDLAPLRQERLPKLIQWGNPDRRISRVGKIGLAGRACHVVFWFYRGKLFAVDLGAAIRPLSIEDRWLWYEGVLGLLRQKYGPEENAAHEFGEIETRNAEWRNPPSIVKLIGARFFDADGVEHVDSTVKYFDPEQERLASGVDPADQSKL